MTEEQAREQLAREYASWRGASEEVHASILAGFADVPQFAAIAAIQSAVAEREAAIVVDLRGQAAALRQKGSGILGHATKLDQAHVLEAAANAIERHEHLTRSTEG